MSELSNSRSEPVIALLDKIKGDEEIPGGVAGIISAQETPLLSHLAVRARQRDIVFVACDEGDLFSEFKAYSGQRVVVEVSEGNLHMEIVDDQIGKAENCLTKGRFACALIHPVELSREVKLLPLDAVTPATGGNKAFGARRLAELSSGKGADFKTPAGVVLPFGVMEESLHASPQMGKEYQLQINGLNGLSGEGLNAALIKLKEIVGRLKVPLHVVSSVIKTFGEDERLIVRSSSNCEDGYRFSGAGAYDSVPNVSPSELTQAVRMVWASLWNKGAVAGRKSAGIPHDKAHMAALIQQMLVPEFSFVMHTVNPVNRSRDEIYLELAVGLGETLTSGDTPGIPYRMVFDKNTAKVRILAFASFSASAFPDLKGGIVRRTVDYSLIDFSRDPMFRESIGIRLGRLGKFVEDALDGPQDIEGLISEDVIYLVQSRPQEGVEC